MTGQANVSINVSLAEIYDLLCPDCREAVVHLLSAKAGDDLFREAVRAQLASAVADSEAVIGPDGSR